jgi:hypothetical protein
MNIEDGKSLEEKRAELIASHELKLQYAMHSLLATRFELSS